MASKLSTRQKARLKIDKYFSKRKHNIEYRIDNTVAYNRYWRQAALQSTSYKADRRSVLKSTKPGSKKRQQALAALKARTTRPYDSSIAKAKAQKIQLLESVKRDKKLTIAELPKVLRRRERARKIVLQRFTKAGRKKLRTKEPPVKMREVLVKKNITARSLSANIDAALKAGRLSITYNFPITDTGYTSYLDLMARARSSSRIQAFQWSVQLGDRGKAMSGSRNIHDKKLWITTSEWATARIEVEKLRDVANALRNGSLDWEEMEELFDEPLTNSDKNLIQYLLDKPSKKRGTIEVRLLLGMPILMPTTRAGGNKDNPWFVPSPPR